MTGLLKLKRGTTEVPILSCPLEEEGEVRVAICSDDWCFTCSGLVFGVELWLAPLSLSAR
jgi:hypothetical protein